MATFCLYQSMIAHTKFFQQNKEKRKTKMKQNADCVFYTNKIKLILTYITFFSKLKEQNEHLIQRNMYTNIIYKYP